MGVSHVNIRDSRIARAVACPLRYRLDCCGRALKHGLDAAVAAIADPACDTSRFRFTLQVHAKADALHVASYA
jgi:hypothetical protein